LPIHVRSTGQCSAADNDDARCVRRQVCRQLVRPDLESDAKGVARADHVHPGPPQPDTAVRRHPHDESVDEHGQGRLGAILGLIGANQRAEATDEAK
jgi:hypothetical protein